jgi:hypothetical protein
MRIRNGLGVGCILGVLALPVAAATAQAADQSHNQATPELLRSELRDLLTRLAASGALEGATAPTALAVSGPPDRVVTLGAILDTANGARDGITVVAVTPGGNAAALGLRAGDAVRSVNGESLVGLDGAKAAARLRAVVESTDGPIRLELSRGSRPLALEGTLKPVLVPGYRLELSNTGGGGLNAGIAAATMAAGPGVGDAAGCGRISQFPSAPRAQQLYRVKIVSIDGHIPGPYNQQNFRASVGSHQVMVAEEIDYRDLPIVHNRARPRNSEKSLTVEVKPNTTTLLAARLLDPPAVSNVSGGYWQPEVWKEISEPCH